jgi:hypothetical protein
MSERSTDIEWPDDVELTESMAFQTVFFTGVKVAVVDGAAHLLLYVEQPSSYKTGETELVVVARLTTSMPRAKAVLESAAARLALSTVDLSSRAVGATPELKH